MPGIGEKVTGPDPATKTAVALLCRVPGKAEETGAMTSPKERQSSKAFDRIVSPPYTISTRASPRRHGNYGAKYKRIARSVSRWHDTDARQADRRSNEECIRGNDSCVSFRVSNI